jgi:glycine/D-amino acid oxidase-like deaminating enzyme
VRLGRSAGLAISAGRVVGIAIDGRVEPAGTVVVTAGPGTSAVVDPSGGWVPIRPLWGVVVEVDLPDAPGHVLEEAEMDVALGTADIVADPDAPDPAPDPAMVPEFSLVTAAGASAVGSTFLDLEPDQQAWVVPILSHATRFVPGIATAPIRSVRACARPLAADGRPLIGQVPGVGGLFICSGHGPWGISTGPGSARLLVDLILGRSVTIPAELDAARFGAPPLG